MVLSWLVALSMLLGVIGSVSAATRLGLMVTQEELTLWRARMTNNVGTINGFTYQSIYQNRLLATANAFRSQSHPGGDGFWAGNTSGTCPPDIPTFGPGRASGFDMAVSAFVFLLTGDASYATGVEANLLSMAQNPNLNFSNTAIFCVPFGYQNGVEIIPWMNRMVLAYDYLNVGGYTGLTTSEKTTIENWLKGGANYWLAGMKYHSANGNWPYLGLFDTPPSLTCTGNCSTGGSPWYYQGHTTSGATELFNGVVTGSVNLVMLTGIMTNTPSMIQDAKNFITAYVPLAINNVGVGSQIRRWVDCSPACPQSAWSHYDAVVAPIIQSVDVLARTGDTSLYTLSAPNQVPGSPAGTVSLFLQLRKWARMVNHTEPIYAYSGSTQGVEISWTDPPWGPWGNYWDFSSMAANLFYQDSEISTAMNRNLLGANSPTNGCNDSQFGGCFSGFQGWWPDLPFMYGNMEGLVNPYVLGSPGDPTVAITAPASGTYVTNISPLTTLAGTATDDIGITGITWTCATCTPNSGTICPGAQCGGTSINRAWSVPSIGLADGGNMITVTATDGTTPVSASLTVTYGPLVTADSSYSGYNTTPIDDGVINPNGNAATTWSSADTAVDHWVLFDFGTARSLSSVTIYWAYDSPTSAYAANHQTLVQSWNGSSYVTQATINNSTMVASNTANFTPISTSRIRLYQPAGQGSNAWPNLTWLTEVNYTVSVAAPSIAITQPTTLPAYGTGTTPLTTVQGTASDDVGITAVTWACPTCGTTSGPATCTPTCGASTTTTTWNIPSLSLSAGTHTLTVTASDGTSTTSKVLTIVYSTTPPDITTNLELWYRFEESSGNALDATGKGHTGTLNGGATRTVGKLDTNALSLNGTGAYVSTPGLLTSPAAVTLAAWVQLSALPTGSHEVLSLGDAVVMRVVPSEVRGIWYAGSSVWNVTAAPVPWDTTTWRHLVYTASAGSHVLYLNGVQVGQSSSAGALVYTGLGSNTLIGSHGNPGGTTFYLPGAVDDVRVYTRALTPRDVVELAAQTSSVVSGAPTVLRLLR